MEGRNSHLHSHLGVWTAPQSCRYAKNITWEWTNFCSASGPLCPLGSHASVRRSWGHLLGEHEGRGHSDVMHSRFCALRKHSVRFSAHRANLKSKLNSALQRLYVSLPLHLVWCTSSWRLRWPWVHKRDGLVQCIYNASGRHSFAHRICRTATCTYSASNITRHGLV